MKSKILFFLPVVIAYLQAADVRDLTITPNDAETGCSVSDCLTTASGSLDIPSTYKGLPITSIEESAFAGCSGLTSITIPDSVTSIGVTAFADCSGLTSITIPNGIASIGNSTFTGCSGLTSITIPDSVTTLGEGAFDRCNSLTSINIPDSVTSIGDYAFGGCTSLASITIADNVTSIGVVAFIGTNISYDYTADNLNYLISRSGQSAYLVDGASASGSVNIPTQVNTAYVKLISDGAFQECTGLTSITIPDSVTSIGNSTFAGCTNLASITIPDGVTSIGNSTFSGCSSLTGITIPDSITSIGGYAFNYCSNLASITIPGSVTSVGDGAFRICNSLVSIIFEEDAPIFEFNVFQGSDSVTIYYNSNYSGWSNTVAGRPAVQTNILTFSLNGDGTEYSLSDCLTSASRPLNIPSSYNSLPVTSVGDGAFQECTSLTSVTIPNSVTSIGNAAFYNCTSLASITIPDSVTLIGSNTFYNCTSLSSITIPDSVNSIALSAFEECTSLTSLSFSSPLLDAAETARDTAEAERDARPTQAAYNTVLSERDARLTETEVRDLKLGSRMLKVVDGNASINIELEITDNLGITNPTWTPVPESKVIIHPNYLNGNIRIDVQADDASNSGVRFFRFKMDGSNSSSDDINLSIGESEYDRDAIIEALAEQYGVPASSISLSVAGG